MTLPPFSVRDVEDAVSYRFFVYCGRMISAPTKKTLEIH